MTRPVSIAAFGLAAALAAPVQAETRPEVTVAVQQIVTSGMLDWARERSNVGARVLHSVYEALIDFERQEADLPMKPGLATSWTQVDDRTVELTLREGVLFHNGDVMTADDVVFSFSPERFGWLSEQEKAREEGRETFTRADGSTGVVPPADVAAYARASWPLLDRVEKVDDMTVRFVSTTSDPTLIGRISRSASAIVSPRALEEAGSFTEHARMPVGTGPYKVVEFRNDNVLVLEPHDAWRGGEAPLSRLRFLMVPETASRVNGLLSGEYDFITDIPPDQIAVIERDSRFEVVGGPITNHRILVFDHNNGPMRDPRVRQAMVHAIDRELIVEALWGGRTRVPPGLQWEYYADMFVEGWSAPEYDMAKARALVEESDYAGEPIQFRVLNNYYANQVSTAQIVAESWRQIGLNIDMQMKENWQQILLPPEGRGVRDWSNSAPFPDPVSSIVNQHCQNGGQQTWGEWTNPEFNDLCTVLETTMDLETRQDAFARMLEIAEREDPAFTVLHQNALFYGKRKDIEWMWSGLQSMDFGPDNFRLLTPAN